MRITNTADRPFALEPCPSYREYIYVLPRTQGTKPSVTDRSYNLNCDMIPNIPSHRTVTFAMVIDVELGVVEQRYDAVKEVLDGEGTVTEVAERYGVTRQSLHNWLRRYRERGMAGLLVETLLSWGIPRRCRYAA